MYILRCFTVSIVCLFIATTGTNAQSDSKETLKWVEYQGDKIDSMMNSVIKSHEQTDLLLKLMDAYLIFETITFVGIYCTDAREAAHIGRNHCDILNYKLSKDLNSMLLRATGARESAQKMKNAAAACAATAVPAAPGMGVKLSDVIRTDAVIADSYLSDGIASEDFHILAQKVELTIRVLHDIQHTVNTLYEFDHITEYSNRAIEHCEAVVKARNWTEVKIEIDQALYYIRLIEKI